MARYRHKDETDLAWNRIRRRITREIDIEIANVREEVINNALTKAWDEFTTALGEGKIPEIESKYNQFVMSIVQDVIPRLQAAGEVDNAPVG